MNPAKHIPNALTLGNLVCGTFLVASAIHPSGFGMGFGAYLVLVGLSLFFDLLDGWAARKLGVQSPLGVQLDSFADFVSFGIAPCALILNYFFTLEHTLARVVFGLGLLSVIICSALRLALYNIHTHNLSYFQGLPIPAQAVGLYGILFWLMVRPFGLSEVQMTCLLVPALFLGAGLMVSRFPMYSFKMRLNAKNAFPLLLVVLVTIIAFIFYTYTALWFGMITYVIVSLVFRKKIIDA